MENPIICPVCGVYFIDGTFRFSYKPTQPISANDVAGLVCSNLSKNPNGVALKLQCINKTGDPAEGDSWEKRLKSIGE
jgi:hypothetical protein